MDRNRGAELLDLRGLPCPEPVLRTGEMIKSGRVKDFTILVSEEVQAENIMRFLEETGWKGEVVERRGEGIELYVREEGEGRSRANGKDGPVYIISSKGIGKGDEELGMRLMKNHLYTLSAFDRVPGAIVMLNHGVFLSLDDSPCLEDLQALEGRGARVLVCRTCLEYYNVLDRVKVGKVSNMYEITDEILKGGSCITL